MAFEPGPDNLPVLRQNLADNAATQVTVSETAVSNTDGHGRLLLAEYSGGHSLAPQATEARGTMPVETVTLDTFVRNHDTGAPDVVKIDVEGAEPAVLEGMATLLDEHHPTLILEIDAASQSEHDDQLERIRSLLDVHHYGMRPLRALLFRRLGGQPLGVRVDERGGASMSGAPPASRSAFRPTTAVSSSNGRPTKMPSRAPVWSVASTAAARDSSPWPNREVIAHDRHRW